MSEKIADVIKETENNKADRQEQYFFRTDQLTVGYDGKPLIREINIQLKKGEILTLIGPNGAGKSTILKSITRQLATISGTVYLDKEKMAKMTNKEVSQKLAVVLTERMRPELMTCEDIVATGRYPYTGTLGILSAEDKTKVKKSMETVHAWDLKDRDFTAISDGQRQRILLARAICQEPEIIILDEPTVGLDPKQIIEIRELIKKLGENHTVILSSHILSEISAVCDHVFIISKGKLVASDATENLINLMSKNQEINLVLKSDEIGARGMLEKIVNIDKVTFEQSEEENTVKAKVIAKANCDIREEIFELASAMHMPILEMHTVVKSLEDVFLELTGEGDEK